MEQLQFGFVLYRIYQARSISTVGDLTAIDSQIDLKKTSIKPE